MTALSPYCSHVVQGTITPASLHPFSSTLPTNRLGFARWLVDTNNPLTARVIMNRFWEQYFGRGIVETVEEFGKQGEPPSHPELLDWLAAEFMRTGWDLKAMHKTIVMSATYRQSSTAPAELLANDPDNRLLARGPKHRLSAEQIRDSALAVSGLLSPKLGGPSVREGPADHAKSHHHDSDEPCPHNPVATYRSPWRSDRRSEQAFFGLAI